MARVCQSVSEVGETRTQGWSGADIPAFQTVPTLVE